MLNRKKQNLLLKPNTNAYKPCTDSTLCVYISTQHSLFITKIILHYILNIF